MEMDFADAMDVSMSVFLGLFVFLACFLLSPKLMFCSNMVYYD